MIESTPTAALQKALAELDRDEFKRAVLPVIEGERNRFAGMVLASDKDDERNRGAVSFGNLVLGLADLIRQELKKRT